MRFSTFLKASISTLPLLSGFAGAAPTTAIQERQDATSTYWFANIQRQGVAAFGESGHKVFRNVKDFGAMGDGVTDDTKAINDAITSGPNRCIQDCDSRTNAPALVYFPPGTYLVSEPLIQTYYTQFVGDAVNVPTLKASAGFTGIAVIDANPYYPYADDNGDAINWYINQNNFFRQVRNFVIDIKDATAGIAGIHWQVAQATSLQNIVFDMKTDQHKGLYIENGSGGFMNDLTFNGGGIGLDIGSQQFTIRNLTFNDCNTAIHMIWNWQFLMQDITVNGGQLGVNMTGSTYETLQVGSLILQDSKFSNVDVGVSTLYKPTHTMTNNTLILDNVDMSEGVPTAIEYAIDKTAILPGNQLVKSFAQGRQYSDKAGEAIQTTQNEPTKPSALVNSNGKVFTRNKPQYADVSKDNFVSVMSAGAAGDGTTDDTATIQSVFNNVQEGQIVYFDHGAYLITDTIKVPKNIKITGEMWPMLMATGNKFADEGNPIPVLKVGEAGDVGDVEMSDLLIETQGPAPGAILMEWNLAGSESGSAGMWDVHFRIGGTAGTQLQSDKCSKTPDAKTEPNSECYGAFMMLHLTATASAYIENCWFWVADHELDMTDYNQINIYNGRGVLIESQKPVWLWGTASEHSQLYNYQVSSAKNLYMGVIQTETAYMQGNPDATVPFTANEGYFDPNFGTTCDGSSDTCARTWGLRVTNSTDIFMYGGGLYSFFDNYGQTCVENQNCQDNMISIEDSTVHLFGITTKASVNMLTHNGESVALDADNRSTFGATVAIFETTGGPQSDGDGNEAGSGSGAGSDSSSSAVSSASVVKSATESTALPSSPIATSVASGSGSSTETTSSVVPTAIPSSDTSEAIVGTYSTSIPTVGPFPTSGVSTFPTSIPDGLVGTPATTAAPVPTDSGENVLIVTTVTVTATGPCDS